MPKLSARTEITSGLTLNDLIHLVNGDASWKLKISTLLGFIFGSGQTTKITYTGELLTPLFIEFAAPCTFVPAGTMAGQQTYIGLNGPTISSVTYNESAGSSPFVGGLLSISFDDMATLQNSLNISNTKKLVTIQANALVYAGSISFSPGPACTTIEFNRLKYVRSGFGPTGSAALVSLSAPELEYVGQGFTPSGGSIVNLSFPKLKIVGSMGIQSMSSLVTLNFPLLERCVGSFAPQAMPALTTLGLASLKYTGTFGPFNMPSLTAISLPALEYIEQDFNPASMAACASVSAPAMIRYGGNISIPSASMANVSSLVLGTIGTLKNINGATITLSGLKLDAASVNGLLALLVSLDGTNGTTLWGPGKTLTINGGTNAAPSGQGITDKATLQARGATVITN